METKGLRTFCYLDFFEKVCNLFTLTPHIRIKLECEILYK